MLLSGSCVYKYIYKYIKERQNIYIHLHGFTCGNVGGVKYIELALFRHPFEIPTYISPHWIEFSPKHTVAGSEIRRTHQLRLVVYTILYIYDGFFTSQVVIAGFLPQKIIVQKPSICGIVLRTENSGKQKTTQEDELSEGARSTKHHGMFWQYLPLMPDTPELTGDS